MLIIFLLFSSLIRSTTRNKNTTKTQSSIEREDFIGVLNTNLPKILRRKINDLKKYENELKNGIDWTCEFLITSIQFRYISTPTKEFYEKYYALQNFSFNRELILDKIYSKLDFFNKKLLELRSGLENYLCELSKPSNSYEPRIIYSSLLFDSKINSTKKSLEIIFSNLKSTLLGNLRTLSSFLLLFSQLKNLCIGILDTGYAKNPFFKESTRSIKCYSEMCFDLIDSLYQSITLLNKKIDNDAINESFLLEYSETAEKQRDKNKLRSLEIFTLNKFLLSKSTERFLGYERGNRPGTFSYHRLYTSTNVFGLNYTHIDLYIDLLYFYRKQFYYSYHFPIYVAVYYQVLPERKVRRKEYEKSSRRTSNLEEFSLHRLSVTEEEPEESEKLERGVTNRLYELFGGGDYSNDFPEGSSPQNNPQNNTPTTSNPRRSLGFPNPWPQKKNSTGVNHGEVFESQTDKNKKFRENGIIIFKQFGNIKKYKGEGGEDLRQSCFRIHGIVENGSLIEVDEGEIQKIFITFQKIGNVLKVYKVRLDVFLANIKGRS